MQQETKLSGSQSPAAQRSNFSLGHLSSINDERGEQGKAANTRNTQSIPPTAHYQLDQQQTSHLSYLGSNFDPHDSQVDQPDPKKPQRSHLGPTKRIKKNKLPTFRQQRLSDTIPQRFLKKQFKTPLNVRKNVPELMSKFFAPYMKKCQFVGQRYKKMRDLPVFLIICFLDLQESFQEQVFQELKGKYFTSVDKKIQQEKKWFKQSVPEDYQDLNLQGNYGEGYIQTVSSPTRERFLICSQIVKDYRLAISCFKDFKKGKWLDSICKFHGQGIQGEKLINNIICFLEELTIIYQNLNIPSRQELQKMNLEKVKEIIKQHEHLNQQTNSEQEEQQTSKKDGTNKKCISEQIQQNPIILQQPNNSMKPDLTDFQEFSEEYIQNVKKNQKDQEYSMLLIEDYQNIQESFLTSQLRLGLQQYDKQLCQIM